MHQRAGGDRARSDTRARARVSHLFAHDALCSFISSDRNRDMPQHRRFRVYTEALEIAVSSLRDYLPGAKPGVILNAPSRTYNNRDMYTYARLSTSNAAARFRPDGCTFSIIKKKKKFVASRRDEKSCPIFYRESSSGI